ncbi:uncharacterized protein METZ01_LOCUS439249, partial [marine metagenome]
KQDPVSTHFIFSAKFKTPLSVLSLGPIYHFT